MYSKILILAFVCLISCTKKATNINEENFSIDIWDFNSSLSYSLHYQVNNQDVILSQESGIEKENIQILMDRRLLDEEVKQLLNALGSMSLNKLKNEYLNPLTEDGKQMKLLIRHGDTTKEIRISNVYVAEIGELVNSMNQLFPEKNKLDYSSFN